MIYTLRSKEGIVKGAELALVTYMRSLGVEEFEDVRDSGVLDELRKLKDTEKVTFKDIEGKDVTVIKGEHI